MEGLIETFERLQEPIFCHSNKWINSPSLERQMEWPDSSKWFPWAPLFCQGQGYLFSEGGVYHPFHTKLQSSPLHSGLFTIPRTWLYPEQSRAQLRQRHLVLCLGKSQFLGGKSLFWNHWPQTSSSNLISKCQMKHKVSFFGFFSRIA